MDRATLREVARRALPRISAASLTRLDLGLEPPTAGPLYSLTLGKGAVGMAEAFSVLPNLVAGLAVTKRGSGREVPGFRVFESAHPVPDATSIEAGRLCREFLTSLPPDATLLVGLSGGASALVEDLRPGVGLTDLQALNARLLASGAPIQRINQERKALSRWKGGGAGRLFPGRIDVRALSDVEGDDLATLGSGPFWIPEEEGARITHRVIGSNSGARAAFAVAAMELGLPATISSEFLVGEARELGPQLVAACPPGAVMVFGGEPTVTLRRPGLGGRCQELALSAALALEGRPGVLLALGTDGTDGPTDAAGGCVDGGTCARIREAGHSPEALLEEHRSYEALLAAADLVVTGPTHTNLNDVVVVGG